MWRRGFFSVKISVYMSLYLSENSVLTTYCFQPMNTSFHNTLEYGDSLLKYMFRSPGAPTGEPTGLN